MWNIEKVTDLSECFFDASSFNQSLNEWSIKRVRTMRDIFTDATVFNGAYIDHWEFSSDINIDHVFMKDDPIIQVSTFVVDMRCRCSVM